MGVLPLRQWTRGREFESFNRSKRGQLQIQETIITIFIFIVLIVFGMIFFYEVQSASIQRDFVKFQDDKLSVDFITLGDLPEFSCSKLGVKESCIDTAKLIAFMNMNKIERYGDYYFTRFSYKNITIRQIYPSKNPNKCSSSRLNDCGFWEIYSKIPSQGSKTKLIRDTPVSLYFPSTDSYGIGILTVEAYDV